LANSLTVDAFVDVPDASALDEAGRLLPCHGVAPAERAWRPCCEM